MNLFDECDIFGDIEVGEQGCSLAYRGYCFRVQTVVVVLKGFVVFEEFYSD
jgi:hypothetical protein